MVSLEAELLGEGGGALAAGSAGYQGSGMHTLPDYHQLKTEGLPLWAGLPLPSPMPGAPREADRALENGQGQRWPQPAGV